ncbi:unnamed protein product [Fusarium graminearum]|uniref:ATP synthase F(0) complex subunit e, mitochondrial n=1 Tax=Fusarium austroamericanum TaxID=282268 RepID=A0AAN6C5C1_FUSAU|nr:hypothetical protein FAUST_3310 [Fusarium austroamericanum]KAI6761836.1 hypothetical protein HG531_002389 [Fusarium graminearum]CAG2003436.1 unnamed protein product [Fusarium graminearum]VTO92301.1 unnamed protein product [Fusarium graminearum]
MASTGVNVRVILPRYGRSTVSQTRAIDDIGEWTFNFRAAQSNCIVAEHAQHEYEKKENLIKQAKAEFAKKKNPSSGDDVITDPSDPKFDLEKLLLKVQKESP